MNSNSSEASWAIIVVIVHVIFYGKHMPAMSNNL